MNKKNIAVYCWKEAPYKFLEEYCNLYFSIELPNKLNEIEGFILHTISLGENKDFILKLKKKNIPLIVHTPDKKLYKSNQKMIKLFELKYNNLYHVCEYDDLVEVAKKLFC